MNEPIREFDKRGNLIYEKLCNGKELRQEFDENNNFIHSESDESKGWAEYDRNNNLTHWKTININNSVYEYWKEYDDRRNTIYYKDNKNKEYFFKYDEYDIKTKITKIEFNKIKREKEEEIEWKRKVSKRSYRFEIIDI